MYFSIHLLKHVLAQFPYLLHFLDSWVVHRKEKGIPLSRPKRTPPSSWRLEEKERINVAHNTHETSAQENREN
jgi:hypothetical protein